MLFDHLRSSLRGALDANRSPGDRHLSVAAMRDALVAARMGVDDVRRGLDEARARVAAARAELDTTRRRGRLAAEVHDAETVAVAERFAASQAERVSVLEAKADAQARELALAERELAQMTAEYRRLAVTGQMDAAPAGTPSDDGSGLDGSGLDASGSDASNAETSRADPDALLAALKRRMGK